MIVSCKNCSLSFNKPLGLNTKVIYATKTAKDKNKKKEMIKEEIKINENNRS